MKLLSIGNDAKTVKGEKQGYLTGIFYGAPHTEAFDVYKGVTKTLCPFSTPGCRAVCLYTAGHGAMNFVQQARIAKSQYWLNDPVGFLAQLEVEIGKLIKQAKRKGMIPAVRLNGTTDIKWEDYGIIQKFPTIQFYDYTKYPSELRKTIPSNYHITYSFSESPKARQRSIAWRSRGFNTAVVFSGGLPKSWGVVIQDEDMLPVIDGDLSDLRFTDPQGVIVGLKTKGKARGVVDAGTGFVQLGS